MPSDMPALYRALTPKLKKLGFQKRGRQYVLLSGDAALGVAADFLGGVYPVFYVIPLLLPAEHPYLTYGNRLSAMFPEERLRQLNRSSTDRDIELWAQEMTEILRTEILPFFQGVSAPEGMLRFLEGDEKTRKHCFFCPPWEILRLRIGIYIRLKDREKAKSLLGEYRQSILRDAPFTQSVKQTRLEEAAAAEQLLAQPEEEIDRRLAEIRVRVLRNCFKM